ncbi:MAG: ComEC/Rec2 family competence protein [Sinomonas sp.]|nr:ComEC/Rec2 family competence protein [Sinomonas sp.]
MASAAVAHISSWRAQRAVDREASAPPRRRLLRDLRLVPLAAAVWAGAAWAPVAAALGISRPLIAWWACLAGIGIWMGAVACTVVRPWPRQAVRRGLVATALVAFAVAAAWGAGFAAGSGRLANDTAGPVGELFAKGGATTAHVEILSEPRPHRSAAGRSSEPRYLADARLLEATHGGVRFAASSRVVVSGGSALARLRMGDVAEAPARVRAGSVDGTGFITLVGAPRVITTSEAAVLPATAREALREASAWLPADAAGLIPALAVGDRSALAEKLEDDLLAAGLGHLTAVSGANFAIVLGSVVLVFRLARCPRWGVVAGCALTLGGFVAIVGFEPSVLRAAAMGSIALLALATGRAGASCSALCAGVIALVLADPLLAVSLGFLLSVLATLGIALLARPLAAALGTVLPAWLSLAVAVPLSAQLLCGPVLVLVRPEFQSWSLVANVLAAPLVPVITVAATIALVTAHAAPPVAWLATAVGGPAAELLSMIAHSFASTPAARVPWPEGALGATAMAVVSVLNLAALESLADPRVRQGAARLAGRMRGLVAGRARGKVDG